MEYDKVKQNPRFMEERRQREYLHKKLDPMRKELLRMKKELNIKDSPDSRPSIESNASVFKEGCSSDSNDENCIFKETRRKRMKGDDRFDDNNNNDRRTSNNSHTLTNSTLVSV